jgi:hypothetical protein
MDQNAGRPGRQYQWSIGLQREIHRNLVVEASYVANRGVYWQAPALLNLNAITPDRLKAFGINPNDPNDLRLLTLRMNDPAVIARGFKVPYAGFPVTQLLGQALRPYPQFAGIPSAFNPNPVAIPVYWDPLGKSWYDSLQVKATQRFSHGLAFFANFAWAKALSLGSEIGEPNPGSTGNAVFNDVFNRNQNKYISLYDQPFQFNFSATYTTPGIGGHKWLSWLVKDWTYAVALQYASGFPLQVPNAQSNLNNYLFQGPSFANRVPGQPLFTVDVNCHCYDPNKTFILNPNAWVDPPAGQFGTSAAYYSDYRTQRRPRENMNLGRDFHVKERMVFSLRIEFTNVFNRGFWGDPTGTALTNAKLPQQYFTTGAATGNTSAGFGRLITTAPTQFGSAANLLPRQGVLVGRFTF